MSKFVYEQCTKDKKWRFRLRGNNKQIILTSMEGHDSEESCVDAIETVKVHAEFGSDYRMFSGKDLLFYFTLQAREGYPLAKSEGFRTIRKRDEEILNCKIEAPRAYTIALTKAD